MSSLALAPFTGIYRAQPSASTVAFAVRHSGVFWYRASLSSVTATLSREHDRLVLAGSAPVDSLSVVEPPQLRAHLLAADFFDAEHHPEIAFRSNDVRLADDGYAEVAGELTIRGVARPITARGSYASPRASAIGEIAGLELHASLDRREFGFEWQMELPDGAEAVGWNVDVDIDLLLIRDQGA